MYCCVILFSRPILRSFTALFCHAFSSARSPHPHLSHQLQPPSSIFQCHLSVCSMRNVGKRNSPWNFGNTPLFPSDIVVTALPPISHQILPWKPLPLLKSLESRRVVFKLTLMSGSMLCKGSGVSKRYRPTHRPEHGTPSSSPPPCSSTKSKPTILQSSSNPQPNTVECGSAPSPPLQPTAQVSLQPSFPAASKPAFNRVRLSVWPVLYNLPVFFARN